MIDNAMAPLVAVLGASGLLGTAVTRELAGRPGRLRLVGRRPTSTPADCRADVEVRTADLTVPGELAKAVAGADVVIHLVAHIAGPATWRVAEGDRTAERVNVGLMQDLIDVLRTQPASPPPVVIFTGSMSQVGRSATARVDGSEPDEPLTVYDRHKLAAEQSLNAATREGVVRGITLRLATLFTQGTDSTALDRGVVAAMTRRALDSQPLTMWHDGTVKRDLLCVDDAARALVATIDHADALAGKHWLIGTGRATSVGDMFRTVSQAVSAHTRNPPVPVVSVEPAEHSNQTDVLDFVVDPTAFQAATGWSAQVDLHAAVKHAVAAIASESARDSTPANRPH